MNAFADAIRIARVELAVEARTQGALVSAGTLGGVMILVVALSMGPDPARLQASAAGVGWIAIVVAAIVLAQRFDEIDRRDDALSALWLAVDDRRSIYLGKVTGVAGLLVLQQAGLWAAAAVLFDVDLGAGLVVLVAGSALASAALAAVAVLVSSLVAAAPQRTLLLPVLLLPLSIPSLLAGVAAFGPAFAGRTTDSLGPLALLAAQAALFAGVGALTYETAAAPE